MDLIQELGMSLLAAIGLLSLTWLFLGKWITPMECAGVPICIVIHGEGAGFGLEHTIHTLILRQSRERAKYPLILVDAGLNEEGRMVARLLLNRWPEVRLCRPEELANYIT